jgi:hypothetical protein
MIMMARLGSGGSVQRSQSPVVAGMGGDRTNMRFPVPKSVVNTAHNPKEFKIARRETDFVSRGQN